MQERVVTRGECLSWLAAMSLASGETPKAEAYLLELLAWCAFADRGSEQKKEMS